MTTEKIAKYFRVSPKTVDNCFVTLKWVYREKHHLFPTNLGIEQGARENYNIFNHQKYAIWNNDITTNQKLIDEINKFKKPNQQIKLYKKTKNNTVILSSPKIIIKQELYKQYIFNIYQMNGYKVWENKDSTIGIDLIVRKDTKISLIKCETQDNQSDLSIKDIDVKAFRSDANDFVELNPLFNKYEIHLQYIVSHNFLHSSAIQYINNWRKNISYEVMKIPII